MNVIVKHFVTFMSPGTFISEMTTREINSWNVEEAMKMARSITERHKPLPYGFYFSTRQNDGELDSKETLRSCNYFLGGEIQTRKEIETRNDPAEQILRDNMRANKINRAVVNTNSWKATMTLDDEDIVLDFTPLHPSLCLNYQRKPSQ